MATEGAGDEAFALEESPDFEDGIEDALEWAGRAGSAASRVVEERTVNVREDFEEDEFFSTSAGTTTVANRYDLERAVPFEKKRHFREVERYWVNKPYAFIVVFHSEKENEKKYYAIEPHLNEIEREVQEFLTGKLRTAIKYSEEGAEHAGDEEGRKAVIEAETRRLLKRYDLFEESGSASWFGIPRRIRRLLGREPEEDPDLEGISARPERVLIAEDSETLTEYQVEKLLYVLKRNFIGYERIDPIKHDINVEDISCDGYDSPVFVYHSSYEQIISNVFHGEEELDDFVVKLAQRSGKGISKRLPQVDATLPDGSRAQLTLGREVSDHGTNYTIRQFKDVPFTPIDLINWNTFSLEEMAFLWLAIENNKSLIFAGGTASGKTTSLNAVSLFIPSNTKIVSIEDTREVELPQRNWVASVTRPSFNDDAKGDVDEFDLLEAALRQRPDYIVMGEIRGEEGRTLFQVMSTGHTTYTTFHADSVDEVLKRFTTDPINVSKTMFTALDLVSVQTQTRVQGTKVRRNKALTEINHYEAENDEINVQDVYQWQAETDEYLKMGDSNTLKAIQFDRGWSREKLEGELFERKVILAYLIENELNTYAEVAATVQAFINDPETILALIANGRLEDSLADLREMESVLIDVDPSKEALVPRPDPTEETAELAAEILDRAETKLLSAYRGNAPGGLASALGGVEPAQSVTLTDGPGATGGGGVEADADAATAAEPAPADGREDIETGEDAPVADADGGIDLEAPSWAEEGATDDADFADPGEAASGLETEFDWDEQPDEDGGFGTADSASAFSDDRADPEADELASGTGGSGSGLQSGSDRLGELFYPLYDRLFDDDSKLVVDIERKLAQARMADTVELYLSRALGLGVISGVALWIGGLTLGYLLFATGLVRLTPMITISIPNETVVEFLNTVYIPGLVVSTGLVFGTIGFLIGFSVLLVFPYSRASSRKREINMLLTDSVSFMYALSVGGLNQLEIIEAMAQADDTYGAVAEEFRSIVQETEYFDVDYRTAIRTQSMETPSDELSQFLTDMLAIVNSGGNMEGFLEDKKEKHMRTAKQQQEMTLETLELFGEMYMTLSLFPLLLIIIMVIMQMVPDANVDDRMLYLTVYGLIPLTGAGFLVLVSTVKHDEPGDGFLTTSADDKRVESARNQGLRNLGLVEEYTGEYSVFDRIKRNEGTHETIAVLRRPHHLFKENPLLTLALTVPASLSVIGVAFVSGAAPTSWDAMVAYPIWGTLLYLYVPLYVIGLPLAVFREWNVRSRTAVIGSLSDDLRKLSSANDTGLTLLESLDSVARTTNGKLAREFETVHAKVNYGMSLTGALVEFNNAYHIPRLARTVKLVTKAQEASNQISDVLRTAAQASENHDDIERERRSRTLMQVVIIVMTFLTLLAVIAILKTQFIDTVAGLETGVESGGAEDVDTGGAGVADANLAGNIDTDLLSLLFFHAVTLQAVLSGLICGYIRDADVLSGLKYVIVLSTIALVTWTLVV